MRMLPPCEAAEDKVMASLLVQGGVAGGLL